MISKLISAASSRQHGNGVLPRAEGFEQLSGKDKKRMAEEAVLNGDALQDAARILHTPEQKGLKLIMDFTSCCLLTDLLREERDAIDPHIYCISADASIDNLLNSTGKLTRS